MVAFGCWRPLASRERACQPSSMTTYSYPALANPEETRVTAVLSTTLWLIVALNVFQLFHPVQTMSRAMDLVSRIKLTHLRLSGIHAPEAGRCQHDQPGCCWQKHLRILLNHPARLRNSSNSFHISLCIACSSARDPEDIFLNIVPGLGARRKCRGDMNFGMHCPACNVNGLEVSGS